MEQRFSLVSLSRDIPALCSLFNIPVMQKRLVLLYRSRSYRCRAPPSPDVARCFHPSSDIRTWSSQLIFLTHNPFSFSCRPLLSPTSTSLGKAIISHTCTLLHHEGLMSDARPVTPNDNTWWCLSDDGRFSCILRYYSEYHSHSRKDWPSWKKFPLKWVDATFVRSELMTLRFTRMRNSRGPFWMHRGYVVLLIIWYRYSSYFRL